MADTRVFIAIMVFIIYVESAFLSGKGLLCRDPDTGKLHKVNTTWPSTSFCGNYTCKLRRLNTTETQYAPIREFNVTNLTNINYSQNKTKNKIDTIEPKIDHSQNKTKIEIIEPKQDHSQNKNETKTKIEPKLDPDINSRATEDNTLNSDTNSNEDRYLTENEIKTISELLHTVKKSDIDAIVDIYNLAQEIYSEMDKPTDQITTVNEAVDNVKEKLDVVHNEYIKPSSYWYDWKSKAEMDTQTTNIVPTTTKLKDIPSYFNGPLTKKDFGKIPYYYPISSFQRMATYVHKPIPPTKPNIVKKPPCQKEKAATKAPVNLKDPQKLIKPSYLLPYPFAYIHNNNNSKQPNSNMYYNNPWIWDYYYRNRQSHPYIKAYIAQLPNAVLINPHLSNEVHDIEQKPLQIHKKSAEKMFEKDTMPDWKTEPLSNKVLNDIKANIDTSQLIKSFPLRKKVKVEKVGKLIKMDENMRHKREVIEDEIPKEEGFEAFIERVTCEQKTEPGYFRYGNLTQPYPHCCPQRILKSR